MAHHSSEEFPNPARKALGDLVRRQHGEGGPFFDMSQLGATGRYPEGKLTDNDEGEIQFALGTKDGKVVLDFGKPVAWLGLLPEQAIDIGQMMINRGKDILEKRGDRFSV